MGRIHDLDILKALAGNLKAGLSQADVHNQLLALARSAREAFHALQGSRDALIALHRKSIGGETVAGVDNITGLPNRASFEARLVPGGDPVIQMLSVTIGISGNKPEDQSWADLFQRARHSLLLARKQVGAGIYIG